MFFSLAFCQGLPTTALAPDPPHGGLQGILCRVQGSLGVTARKTVSRKKRKRAQRGMVETQNLNRSVTSPKRQNRHLREMVFPLAVVTNMHVYKKKESTHFT